MFTLTLKKTLSTLVIVASFITFSASAQQFELNGAQTLKKAQQHRGLNPKFSAPQGDHSKITAHCWTVSECNQMISDCISVNGSFRSGITDHKTGATSEGSCTL
tara:strand:- start:1855 stop:2166 length:312 start_codon:yes stop_codon:yes gene_type:complete